MPATRDSYILMNFEEHALTLYFSYKIHEEDGKYVAECPQLQCMDQGDTRIDAIDNLKLMIRDIIDYAVESQRLDEILRDLKFKAVLNNFNGPFRIYVKKNGIDDNSDLLRLQICLPVSTGRRRRRKASHVHK